MNGNYITQRLAVGGAPLTRIDGQILAGWSITHVLNTASECDDRPFLPPGMEYLANGLPDNGQPKPEEWFQRGIDFAFSALSQPGKRLYVHCLAGVQRGPSMAYAILRAFGHPPQTAARLIQRYRPKAQIGYRADADRAIRQLGYESPDEGYIDR